MKFQISGNSDFKNGIPKIGVCASDLFLSPMGNRISKCLQEPIEGAIVQLAALNFPRNAVSAAVFSALSRSRTTLPMAFRPRQWCRFPGRSIWGCHCRRAGLHASMSFWMLKPEVAGLSPQPEQLNGSHQPDRKLVKENRNQGPSRKRRQWDKSPTDLSLVLFQQEAG